MEDLSGKGIASGASLHTQKLHLLTFLWFLGDIMFHGFHCRLPQTGNLKHWIYIWVALDARFSTEPIFIKNVYCMWCRILKCFQKMFQYANKKPTYRNILIRNLIFSKLKRTFETETCQVFCLLIKIYF